MINLIKQFILNNSSLFSSSSIKKVNIIQLAASYWRNFDYGRLVYLIFINYQPKAVAKLYRTSKHNDTLAKEFEVLKDLQSHTTDLYPKPIILAKIAEHKVLFEAFIEGYSLLSELTSINYLPATSLTHLSGVFREHFNIAYSIFREFNIQKQKGSSNEEEKELKNLINKYAFVSNTNIESIKQIEDTILVNNPKTSYKRIVNFDFVPKNVFKTKNSYKLIDFEFSRESYLWYIEPVRFIFSYLLDLIELGILKGSFLNSMKSFRLNPKNIFEIEAIRFCQKCLGSNPKLLQKAFLITSINSYLLYKKISSFIRSSEEQILKSVTDFWIVSPKIAKNESDIKIVTESKHLYSEDIESVRRRLRSLQNEIKLLTSSRGWKIVSFIYNIRIKIPILKSL